MVYSKDYFQIQIDFAERVQAISGKPLEECLMEYTSFYKSCIPDWNFDSNHPRWAAFMNEFKGSNDGAGVIARLQAEREPFPHPEKYYGCFRYEYDEDKKTIFTHFRNAGDPIPGVLSSERKEARLKELKEMFTDIKKKYPSAEIVSGFSWLYNIEAYKRLYPEEYVNNATEITSWYKTTALWGQFVHKTGEVRKEMALSFRNCIKNKKTIEELKNCFPYKVLQPKAGIEHFYGFYGVK